MPILWLANEREFFQNDPKLDHFVCESQFILKPILHAENGYSISVGKDAIR